MQSSQKIEIDLPVLLVVMRDYYCSEKFDYLEVRLYDGFVASCCNATPDRLTKELLANDPNGFFNWPKIVQEREQMLRNERVAGCEQTCWTVEDQGLKSRRHTKVYDSDAGVSGKKYTSTRQIPTKINLVTNNNCNLTCSYCCKTFSSTWYRDIDEHGSYDIDGTEDRYKISNLDRVQHQYSQKMLDNAPISSMILDQLERNIDTIKNITITGGEPLLYSDIERILEFFSNQNVWIYTGMGVSNARLKKIMPLLERHGIRMFVSAENTGRFHEFNRYGSNYEEFKENLALIKTHCHVSFSSTISNLSIFDFSRFYQYNRDSTIKTMIVSDPTFMHPSVLDPASKEAVANQMIKENVLDAEKIIPMMQLPTDVYKQANMAKFLKRFVKTRNLDVDIFPATFLDWLNTAPDVKIFPIKAQT